MTQSCRHHADSFISTQLAAWALLLLFPIPASLYAQCRNSDFPGPDGVAAAPSRPVESSSPDPIQTGVAEFESGFAHSWINGQSSQYALSNLIKLGAWCNVEVRWSANAFVSNTVSSNKQSGFGDNYLAAQYRFHRESPKLPSMAVGYSVKFPSADPVAGLGSGNVDHMFMLLFGKNLKKFSVVVNANYFAIGAGNGRHDGKAEFTLLASRPIQGRWGLIGEIYYDSHLNSSNAAYGNSTWGLTYTVNPRLIFDGGAYVGLSNGPGVPGNSAFFGVSYAPGRLFHKPRVPRPSEE